MAYMSDPRGKGQGLLIMLAGLLAWLVPGAGYLVLGDRNRFLVVFVTILATFILGLYIGSIGVVDPQQARYWYIAQVMTSPAVMLIGNITRSGQYPVYGRPYEIGQIYTSIAGLLNLLCIVNVVYLAYRRMVPQAKAGG